MLATELAKIVSINVPSFFNFIGILLFLLYLKSFLISVKSLLEPFLNRNFNFNRKSSELRRRGNFDEVIMAELWYLLRLLAS
jgi:hypothetical protein